MLRNGDKSKWLIELFECTSQEVGSAKRGTAKCHVVVKGGRMEPGIRYLTRKEDEPTHAPKVVWVIDDEINLYTDERGFVAGSTTALLPNPRIAATRP